MMSATTMDKRGRSGKGKRARADAGGTISCSTCGETNQAHARFCQACGRSLSGDGWGNVQLLILLGAGLATLLALGLLFASVIDMGSNDERSAEVATPPSRTASLDRGQPPDLSTMSPREAADRLFNRVMMADEQGNSDEVAEFAPMAVAAYERLDELDLDGIYHVGLIKAASGDAEGAKDAVERLRAVVPGHLLASLLDYRLAKEAGDQARAASAVERFRTHVDEEIAVDRPEYREHQRQIDQFRQQLRSDPNGTK